MIVMKFGGSSVADSERMLKVLEIVKNQKGKKIVVLSACQTITDKLEKTANLAKNKSYENAQNVVNEIASHHINIINTTFKNKKIIIEASKLINNYISELNNLIDGIFLLQELTPAAMDSIFSFGELLSTTIFHYLCLAHNVKNKLIDARQLIITDSTFNNAFPMPNNYEKNMKNIIKKNLSDNDIIITQGFIASDTNSKTTTLGRGGSDLTASLIGAAINADEIQIWTDVNGVLTADPKKFNNTATVAEMTFQEIRDLSFWGAKVLHPKTILPAIEKNIIVKVLNSFNPNSSRTTITANSSTKNMIVNSVISKKCYLFNMRTDVASSDMTTTYDYASITNFMNCDEIYKKILILYFGYNNGIFTILFENKNENFEAADSFIQNNLFVQNIKSHQILFSAPVSVICISGQNFKSNSVQFTEFISLVGKYLEKINLQQLVFQYSDSSIIFVVDECKIDEVVKKIHNFILEKYFR